jgi:hypothetical protein
MHHKTHSLQSTKSIMPLAGSVCGLIAGLSLAFTPVAIGKEPVSRVRDVRAENKQEPKAAPRSPDDALHAGLEYLLKQQQEEGGWGQGGGWRQGHDRNGGRVEGANVEDPADIGNSCVSLVALLRAGDSPAQGEHREASRKAFEFICRQVEKADDDSLYVTPVRDTQLQVKIGTYVDTFLTGWALSELKGRLADEAAEKRRAVALDKVVAKIERNQKDDGSFAENKGWAAVLSQGLCSKALNSAARSGAKVSSKALDKDQQQNLAGLDVAKGDFSVPVAAAEPSSAGVSLYREAAKLGGLREKVKSNAPRRTEAEKTIADPAAPAPEKARARDEIKQFADDDKAAQVAQRAVAGKLADTRYVAGFGNNGGEEFLSYLNLGESMRERGGKEWDDWKGKMQATLCGAQNADGSWAGQHCITGRTFCTSAALLTLLVERAQGGAALSSVDSAKSASDEGIKSTARE